MDNASNEATIKDETSVRKSVNLKLDESKTQELLQKKLEAAAKKSNIKGFRPGKAPVSIIKKYYEQELFEEAAAEILNEDFRKIVSEKGIYVVGTPTLEKKTENEYSISFDVMPEVKNLNLNVKVKKNKKRDITDEVIQEEINFLLERLADQEKLDDSAVINQDDKYFVKIDYVTIDETGKEVDSAKDYSISLNSSIIDKTFEASFIGKKKGDSFEFDDKERKVVVKGFIKEIDKKILPELNAETIKNFGDFKDASEFRQYVEKSLNEYEEKRYKDSLRASISEELVNLNPVELPESIVEEDAKSRLEEMKKQGKYKDINEKHAGEFMGILRIMAKRDIALYLLLSEIEKSENITVTESDLEEFYKHTAALSNMKEDEVKGFYSAKEAQENLKHALLEDKTFDFLIQNKVSYIEE
ncbi:MAG: trigger factor [Deltaproteobacteria bacterium]|jgi:trigger factor|nr:trigger factor [Deltaproteobacteria bacterium]